MEEREAAIVLQKVPVLKSKAAKAWASRVTASMRVCTRLWLNFARLPPLQ